MLHERLAPPVCRSVGWRLRVVIVTLAVSSACQIRPARAERTADPQAARRTRVEQMSAEDRDRLLRQRERFASLSHEEQNRLRTFHEQVDRDPQRHELRRVMHNYYRWLKTLSPSQRAEIARMLPDERLAVIRQVQERRQRRTERHLAPEDLQALADWLEGHLLSKLPEPRREWLARRLEGRKGPGQWMMVSSWYSRNRGPRPSPESIEQLATVLRPGTRERLLQADGRTRRRLLWSWNSQLSQEASRQLHERLRQVDEEELSKVFERLPDWERERLLDLPPDQIQRELRLIYFQSRAGGARGRRGESPGEHPPRDPRRRHSPPDDFRRGPPPERPPRR